MSRRSTHPFADRWNHNTHHFPLLATLLPDEGQVLDVGCGDGTFARFVAGPGRSVTGVDPDASVLPTDGEHTTYVAGSAEDLPFPDATFAAVTMIMALHHTAPARALAEAGRVLTPGGCLLVLGIGRYGGWRDLPAELRDAVAHRVAARDKAPWEPDTVKADPALTWRETRSLLDDLLPGSTWRRLPMWRHLTTWHKPIA